MLKRIRSEEILGSLQNLAIRFPLTLAFIIALTGWQLYENDFTIFDDSTSFILVTGILLSAVAQLLYERFYIENENTMMRWILYGASLGLVALYGMYIAFSLPDIDEGWYFYSIPGIRTLILYFVLIVLMMWLPTFERPIKFSQSFLVTFKAFFIALFFSVVLFVGVASTISLFETLFFSLDTDWFDYTATLVFNLFAPILFFAFIPEFYKYETEEEEAGYSVAQAINVPKFLRQLITFILIPIMGLLTVIIIAYIVTNLTSEFFKESLIEGLLLTYTIYGWILLMLADNVENKIAGWFRRVFPFSLIFVIILQMISTFLQIQEVGVTHGRYLILLFGVGSVISAVWYIVKQQSLKVLPLVSMVAGLIAMIPPVDAMSVSVRQQEDRLYDVFERNEMLVDEDTVEPNPDVSDEDQEIVRVTLNYLSEISALNQLSWLPEEYYYRENEYLGFVDPDDPTSRPVWDRFRESASFGYVSLEEDNIEIDVNEFDHFFVIMTDSQGTFGKTGSFEMEGQTHTFEVLLDNGFEIYLTGDQLSESLRFDFSYVLEEFMGEEDARLPVEELTFTETVEDYTMRIVIKSLQINGDQVFVEFYLLI